MKSEEDPYMCRSRSVEVSVDTLTGLKSAVECQRVKFYFYSCYRQSLR